MINQIIMEVSEDKGRGDEEPAATQLQPAAGTKPVAKKEESADADSEGEEGGGEQGGCQAEDGAVRGEGQRE